MKTVILCGGLGTRLSEETTLRPKPMVEVGPRPILWHILKIFSHYGYDDFVLALGYKAEVIKEYFLHYHILNSSFSVRLNDGQTQVYRHEVPSWDLHMIDTGDRSMTGGRLLRLKPFLAQEETFMLTYGDGVADVDVGELVRFHQAHGRIATVTAVRPTARFGGLHMQGDQVVDFDEKPQLGEGWINGGFFVFNRGIFDYLENDQTILERAPMEGLVRDGQLMAYRHPGFWQCMDTRREKDLLEQLWNSNRAPWKVWSDGDE